MRNGAVTLMPPSKHHQLEELLRTSAPNPNTEEALPADDDPVVRRVALYAELRRLAPPPVAESKGRVLLSAEVGAVRSVPLGDTPVEIGRGAECALRLADPEASGRHCRAGTDDGGANGTWLNDRQVRARVPLRDGDVIRAGQTLLVFVRN